MAQNFPFFADAELCGFLCAFLLLSLCEPFFLMPHGELIRCALPLSPDTHAFSS